MGRAERARPDPHASESQRGTSASADLISDDEFTKLVSPPAGMDPNEWLATHGTHFTGSQTDRQTDKLRYTLSLAVAREAGEDSRWN